jgi:hypothetical protein
MVCYLEKAKRFCYEMRYSQPRDAVLMEKTYSLLGETRGLISIAPMFAVKGSSLKLPDGAYRI